MCGKKFFILSAVIFILLACESREQPWNPVFEDTSFRYLENEVTRALEALNSAENQLRDNHAADAGESLDEAKQICLTLKDYYIPLTLVRHQIYDADRFFYLKKKDKAKSCLEESRQIVEQMNRFTEGGAIHGALKDLVSMIEECILSLEENTQDTNDKFKNLGHKVNLMLIKGGLIVSDMKFL